MNRPQPAVTVHPGLLPDEYREVVAHLGGQVFDLVHIHRTLNPLHPGGLSAGEQKQAGDSR